MTESVEQLRNTYPLGSRIRWTTDDAVGTVRYVGEVAGHSGSWLGIEWDDEQRGKHDGTVNGVRYFRTRHPRAGSMIRGGRVAQRISLRHAIETKYVSMAGEQVDDRLLAETRRRLHASIFEVVGMDKLQEKQSHWDRLTVVSIERSNVYMAGILTQLVHLTDLHLTESLIADWACVTDVLRQVPSIEHLNLSQSRLRAPDAQQTRDWRPHFRRLRAINLRDCALGDWAQVLRVARLWPNVRKLGLQENGLRAFETPPADDDNEPCLQRLEQLDLSLNGIEDFRALLGLAALPALRALSVADNRMAEIGLPECEPDACLSDCFAALVELNVKENPIRDDCAALNELDKLPALTTLMWSLDGQTGGGFGTMFSHAVSRLTRLQTLNGMPLAASDRRGAEYDLWKAHGAQWMRWTDAERTSFARDCRAYPRLVQKYGQPDVCLVAPKVSNLLMVHLRSSSTTAEDRVLSKRVSRVMSVQALQGLALKWLAGGGGVPGLTLPRLSYLDRSRADLKIPMDNLSKSLDYYSVQDGDSIIIDW